jgi:mRNA-degrading endonuclease RelE of RelBE toxin-antitoxin system
MKVYRTTTFKNGYKRLPQQIQEACDKKLEFLLKNLLYPSLRTKKVKGHSNIWEASITMDYRFTFQIEKDILVLRKIGRHKILQNP